MEWDPIKQDTELLNFYKKVICIRKMNSCLRKGNVIPLICEKMVYGYVCQFKNQQIYVLLNGAEEEREVMLPVLKIAKYEDLLTGKNLSGRTSGKRSLSKPRYDFLPGQNENILDNF